MDRMVDERQAGTRSIIYRLMTDGCIYGRRGKGRQKWREEGKPGRYTDG